MKVKFFIVAALSLSCSLFALALEFQPLGSMSISMGGAGVASAGGPLAGYYNPALLTESGQTFQFDAGAGAGLREFNLAENIDRLSELDLENSLTRVGNNILTPGLNSDTDRQNVQEAQSILQSMSGGKNSISLMPEISLGLQLKHISIGAFGTSEAAAQAIIDPNHLDLIVQNGGVYASYNPGTNTYSLTDQADFEANSLQFALDNELTYLNLNGLALVEVPVSYAKKISLPLGKLSIGASAKLMSGTTSAQNIYIGTESDDISDLFEDNHISSTAIGVDAGLLYQPPILGGMRIGLVAKNLNSPSFETATGDLTVDPMYRAGISLGLMNKVDLAVDCDLSKNKTVTGMESQYLGGGINFHPTNLFSFRIGARQNIADPSVEGIIATAGIGIGLKQLTLDIAGEMSSKKGSFDNNEIPREARASISLISRW